MRNLMKGTSLGILALLLGLLVGGCKSTPEIQGAVLASPPASSPALQATDVGPGADASPSTPEGPIPVPISTSVESATVGEGAASGPLSLESPAFAAGASIPLRFACDGEDISPALAWGSPPDGTASFALIMDDPDAPGGTWVHWILFDIPAESRGMAESVPTEAELPDGSRQGMNSGHRLGYAGPCPPGETHRYFFKLFALDQNLGLDPGVSVDELTAAMQDHVLGQAELMGTYTRD
jgi:Raf kinase inhibitor-like YbhB/YbcL family protein